MNIIDTFSQYIDYGQQGGKKIGGELNSAIRQRRKSVMTLISLIDISLKN